MITMLNHDSHNWDKYNVLFKKAWSDLKEKNKLDDEDLRLANEGKIAFADLAHYFAYIRELINIDPIYVMLPIDETPFEINANARTIKVPADFAKCSGVQSDNYAEIVTFTIDRYFDYKDLAAPGIQIAVQWINQTSRTEGVSMIQLIDLETYGNENKIRFGWPLTAEMTEAAGNLRFAVRFFSSETDADGKIAFNYILNTMEASIPIKSTLSVDFNSDNIIKKATDLELFRSYITNSQNPSYGIPTQVVFTEDLENKAFIDLDTDTLTLTVSAQTKDLNPIVYEWYRKQNDVITKIETQEKLYTVKSVEFIEYAPLEWPSDHPDLDFWVSSDDVEGFAYKPFEEPWPEERPSGENALKLYVRRSTLTFDAGADKSIDITGIYYAKAINDNGKNIAYTNSNECKLLAPETVTIIKDLVGHQFFNDDKILSVEIEADSAQPQKTYKLFKLNDETKKWGENPALVTENVYNNSVNFDLKDLKFGTYRIDIDSTLNRKTEENSSSICYVSDDPIAPIGENKVFNYDFNSDDNGLTENGVTGEQMTKDNNTSYTESDNGVMFDATDAGATYKLQADIAQPGEDENVTIYNTGTLTYKWECAVQDGPGFIPVERPADTRAGNIATHIIDEDSLVIRILNPIGDELRPVYTYKCTVTNTIDTIEDDGVAKSAESVFIFTIR